MNENGWLKPILVGVAILVLGAAVVGSAKNTFSNSLAIGKQEVKVGVLEAGVAEQRAAVSKIPVMDERIKVIQRDVRKILDKMDK